MKATVVLAALFIAAAAVFVGLRPESLRPAAINAVKKSDMFGFAPGMSFEEVNKVISQRRHRCRQSRDSYNFECSINNAKVTIHNDELSDRHPTWRVSAELDNAGTSEAAVNSISEQYNAQPTKDAKGRWVWIVGRDFKLSYDGVALTLVDEAEERRRMDSKS